MNQRVDHQSRITVEVCTGSLSGAIQAETSGADRIELNCALELDGLTPSAGLFDLVKQSVSIPIIAMARPRSGNFCYSSSEWNTLTADVRWLFEHGARGVAFGCLDAARQVDVSKCREMRQLAGDREIVFHKAFDDLADWKNGLERLVDCGVDRVMTSGQCRTAEAGMASLAECIELADGRIEVLPAGGITSKNAVRIAKYTGCRQIHGSFAPNRDAEIGPEIERTIELLDAQLNRH